MILFSFFLSLTLSGCASTPRQTNASPDRQYQENLQITGRISVQYQQNDKEQTLPGSFEWQQTATSTNITLLSPLGQVIATIQQTPTGASMQQAGKATRYASDLDSLLNDSLGWALPVSGLRDWLQGFSLDTQGKRIALKTDDNTVLDADGWHLRYVTWNLDSTPLYPKRINLQRNSVQAGEIAIRIAIEQWTLQ
ncbi:MULTISPECIES: lipoprotein insertase outer membrane protein LolB [unclassified Undibacterium]|uniref:lipoprotein insertase outer membrane protein LolB n=1 Tax=unclassified Undibacterium TaxID=2630295 RepID=UPI0033965FE8